MVEERLARQIEFLMEIDKLKTIYRRSYLAADTGRRENSAEHSWHVVTTAMVLLRGMIPSVSSSAVRTPRRPCRGGTRESTPY